MLLFYDNLLSNPKNVKNKTINSARKLTREELKRAKYKHHESSISKKLHSVSVSHDVNMFNNSNSVQNFNVFSLHDSNIYKDRDDGHNSGMYIFLILNIGQRSIKSNLRRKLIKRQSLKGKEFVAYLFRKPRCSV